MAFFSGREMDGSAALTRSRVIRDVSRALAKRQLVWFGTRGEDAESLSDIPQFSGSYSLISTLNSRPSVKSASLEDLTGIRPDLDTYELDDHLRSKEVSTLRDLILQALSRPSALITYRPTVFLSAIGFSRQDRCQYLGMFKGLQNAFEHKPWLESAVAELGIPCIQWRYIPDRELLDSRQLFRPGPIMLRRSRTTGGVGLFRVDDPDDLESLWPQEDEAFVSVSPFIADGIPLNVGGVVWRDDVTVHRASIQLIGIEECTTRPFGYCGNDFVRAAELEPEILDRVEWSTRMLGAWLRSSGYLGAFGADFLIKDGVPLFTEVNPRFQGSTHLSCQLSVEREESCLLTEHLAAFLNLEPPKQRPLREQMDEGVELSHLVIHNTSSAALGIDPASLVRAFRAIEGFQRADVLTRKRLVTEQNGTIARLAMKGSITLGGFDLLEPYRSLVRSQQVEFGTRGELANNTK